MAKISVIGLVGSSVFMSLDHFHDKGETISAESYFEEIGGKGYNQAVACAKMGATVSFLGSVGKDIIAQKCRESARKYGISAFFAEKDVPTTVAVILTDKLGENRVTVYRSAELTVADVSAFEEEIKTSDILLLQNEVPISVNIKAVEIAKKYGVKIILNPAPIREIPKEVCQMIYAVTPNEQESAGLEGLEFQNVITTLGEKGCLINGVTSIFSPKVNAVDSTGAGDTFNGALAVFLAEGYDIETACKYAVTASSLSVTKKYVLDSIPKREVLDSV